MSRDAGGEPRPPRRAKPAPKPKPKPIPEPESSGDDEPTTWRPSPAPKPPSAGKPKRSKSTLDEPRVETGGPNWFERVIFGSVGTGQLATFCRQSASYLDAGVDLVKAL